MTKLLNDKQMDSMYTKVELTYLITRKADILNLHHLVPKGFKQLKKAELIAIVRKLDSYTERPKMRKAVKARVLLGRDGYAKRGDIVTILTKVGSMYRVQTEQDYIYLSAADKFEVIQPKTLKLNAKSKVYARYWKHLQRYMQENDRNGEWFNMPPTLDNVVYTLDVLNRWEEDENSINYVYALSLCQLHPNRVQTCSYCDKPHLDGFVTEWNGNTYCVKAHMIQDNVYQAVAEGLEDGSAYWTDWRDA